MCFQSSVAKDGKIGHGLKLKNNGPTFSSFNAMPGKNTEKLLLLMLSDEICLLSSYLYKSILCICIMALSNDFGTELIDLKQQYPRDITPFKGKGFYSHSCYKLNKTNAAFTPKSSYMGVSLIFGASIFEFVCE